VSATACPSKLARSYVPRAPEETVWHRVLRDHLATFLESEKDPDSGVPDFVERELRAVILCGSPALGFIRVACTGCPHEMLVPYSCHARAACPSCGARRIKARFMMRHLAMCSESLA
jgi:ribosomal protein S27E